MRLSALHGYRLSREQGFLPGDFYEDGIGLHRWLAAIAPPVSRCRWEAAPVHGSS